MATLSLLRTASQTFTLASYMAVSFLSTWHLLLNYLPTVLKQFGRTERSTKSIPEGTLWTDPVGTESHHTGTIRQKLPFITMMVGQHHETESNERSGQAKKANYMLYAKKSGRNMPRTSDEDPGGRNKPSPRYNLIPFPITAMVLHGSLLAFHLGDGHLGG